MTREEAIRTLITIDGGLSPNFVANGHIAMGMAIKALEHPEQNVIAVVPCGDAISRQAVLEKAINVPIAKVVTEDTVLYRKIVFADDIEDLPSVTLKPETVTEFADRCKECGREKVLDKIRAELHATAEMHEDGDYYLRDKWVDEIIDKYKQKVRNKK